MNSAGTAGADLLDTDTDTDTDTDADATVEQAALPVCANYGLAERWSHEE